MGTQRARKIRQWIGYDPHGERKYFIKDGMVMSDAERRKYHSIKRGRTYQQDQIRFKPYTLKYVGYIWTMCKKALRLLNSPIRLDFVKKLFHLSETEFRQKNFHTAMARRRGQR